MNVFVDRVLHGAAGEEGRLAHARRAGREFRIEPGKRAEFRIGPGEQAVVYLLEGSARFEGDDSPALGGDAVWFKPAPQGGTALLGVQADTPVRGILVSGPMREARPGI